MSGSMKQQQAKL